MPDEPLFVPGRTEGTLTIANDRVTVHAENLARVLLGPAPDDPSVRTNLSEVRFPPASAEWGDGPFLIRLEDGTTIDPAGLAEGVGNVCKAVVDLSARVGELLGSVVPAPPERTTRFERTTPFDED